VKRGTVLKKALRPRIKELRKSVARAYLVFAGIFVAGLAAGIVEMVYDGQWDWRAVAASPITGFHMALQAIVKGGFLVFPIALAVFLARAWWRGRQGNVRE
jgi:hypothetical protein